MGDRMSTQLRAKCVVFATQAIMDVSTQQKHVSARKPVKSIHCDCTQCTIQAHITVNRFIYSLHAAACKTHHNEW